MIAEARSAQASDTGHLLEDEPFCLLASTRSQTLVPFHGLSNLTVVIFRVIEASCIEKLLPAPLFARVVYGAY